VKRGASFRNPTETPTGAQWSNWTWKRKGNLISGFSGEVRKPQRAETWQDADRKINGSRRGRL